MKLANPSKIDGNEPSVFMEMPMEKATFCLRRAIEDYQASRGSFTADMLLLIHAGAAAGAGTTLGAASAAMADGDRKKDMGIASVTLIAAGGAILGLRTALNLNELGRAQRIGAARSVNAAINILEKYAMSDDPKTVGDDGFGTCRDADVDIANAYLPSSNAAAIEQLAAKAKTDQQSAAKDVASAKEQETKATARVKASDVKVDTATKKVGAAQAASPSPIIDPKGKGPPPPAVKSADLLQAEKDLAAAQEQKVQADADLQAAKLNAAKADLAEAKANIVAAKAGVLEAGGMLRRAAFYLTGRDVEQALKALKGAMDELDAARARVKVAQDRVDELAKASTPPATP
jgi:hypothetical protein